MLSIRCKFVQEFRPDTQVHAYRNVFFIFCRVEKGERQGCGRCKLQPQHPRDDSWFDHDVQRGQATCPHLRKLCSSCSAIGDMSKEFRITEEHNFIFRG